MLLDDVLAALDVHTAKQIVDEALRGELVRDRTILLVTHNIALAAPIADHVLLLGKNGKVLKQGTVADVLKHSAKLRAQVVSPEETKGEEETAKETKEEPAKSVDKAAAGKLVVAEEKAIGRLGLAALMLYVRSYGGLTAWTITALLLGFTVLSEVAQPWFVGIWSSQYERHPASEIRVAWSVFISSCLLVGPLTSFQVLFHLRRYRYNEYTLRLRPPSIHGFSDHSG